MADYLNDQKLYDAFAEDYGAYVEDALKQSGLNEDDVRLLQASRVHLAISYRNGQRALDAAQALKDLQSDPRKKAMTGLLTKAIVKAQERSPDDLWSPYVMEVQRQFSAQLTLVEPGPSLEELQAMNRQYATMEAGALVTGFLENYEESVDANGQLDLEAADALARVRHKVLDILPLTRAIRAAINEQIHHLKAEPWHDIPGIEKQMLVPATMKYPKNSEGSMIELKNGDILFMWSQFTDVTRMTPDEDPPSAGLRRSPLSDDGFLSFGSHYFQRWWKDLGRALGGSGRPGCGGEYPFSGTDSLARWPTHGRLQLAEFTKQNQSRSR